MWWAAVSMLQSILSSRLPCWITTSCSYLYIVFREWIELTIFRISSFLSSIKDCSKAWNPSSPNYTPLSSSLFISPPTSNLFVSNWFSYLRSLKSCCWACLISFAFYRVFIAIAITVFVKTAWVKNWVLFFCSMLEFISPFFSIPFNIFSQLYIFYSYKDKYSSGLLI